MNGLTIQNHCTFNIEPIKNKDAERTMRYGCDLLDSLNFHYWITSGNLLGIYRDGKLIDHDTDIDTGILLHKSEKILRTSKLIKEMKKKSFKHIRSIRFNNIPMQLAFLHTKTDVIFDIFLYYTGIKDNFAVNFNDHGIIYKPLYFIDELKEIVFNGVKYPRPNKIKKYMKWRFGDNWKTPASNKVDWSTECTHLTKYV
jgi:hypothetical protein